MKKLLGTAILSVIFASAAVAESFYTFDNVLSLQIRLHELGYYHGAVNGEFGVETENALVDYQNAQNVGVVGQFDRRTFQHLGLQAGEYGDDAYDIVGYRVPQNQRPQVKQSNAPAAKESQRQSSASDEAQPKQVYVPEVVEEFQAVAKSPVVAIAPVKSAVDDSNPVVQKAPSAAVPVAAPPVKTPVDNPLERPIQVVPRVAKGIRKDNFSPPVNPYWENQEFLDQAAGASPIPRQYKRRAITPLLRLSTSVGGDKVFRGFPELAGKPATGVNAADGISIVIGSHFAFRDSPLTLRGTAGVRFTSDSDGDVDASLNTIPLDLMLVYSFKRVQIGAGPAWQFNARAKYKEDGQTLVSAKAKTSLGYALDIGWRPLDVSSAHLNFRYENAKLDYSESGGKELSANQVSFGVGWGY